MPPANCGARAVSDSSRPEAVLLTRPRADSERIAADLRLRDEQVLIWPLSEVRWHPVPTPPPDTEALLFTSANGVAAFAHGCPIRDLPALCVGTRTADAARAARFTNVATAGGTADALADLARRSGHRRLFYPRGRTVSVDLTAALGADGLTVTEAVVYAMEPGAPPESAVRRVFQTAAPVLVTVWSAGAAARMAADLQAHPDWRLDNADLLAISDKAAAPLGIAPFRHIFVASKPDADAMKSGIRAALRQKSERR